MGGGRKGTVRRVKRRGGRLPLANTNTLFSSFSRMILSTIVVSLYIFLYLSAFSFLLVESLIILHKLVDKIILEKLEKSVFVLASGSLPPLLFTLLTVPFLPPSLLSAPDQQSMCSLNFSSST